MIIQFAWQFVVPRGMYVSLANSLITQQTNKGPVEIFFFSDTLVPTSADSSADTQLLQPLAATGQDRRASTPTAALLGSK